MTTKIFKPILLLLLMAMTCVACQEELPFYSGDTSYRDNRYSAKNSKVYIDGKAAKNISEVIATSTPIGLNADASHIIDEDGFEWNMKLMIKGLEKKGKYFFIDGKLKYNIDDFVGATTLKGVEYDVTVKFLDDPLRVKHEDQRIEVYLESK